MADGGQLLPIVTLHLFTLSERFDASASACVSRASIFITIISGERSYLDAHVDPVYEVLRATSIDHYVDFVNSAVQFTRGEMGVDLRH
jgi:hypothetical protein